MFQHGCFSNLPMQHSHAATPSLSSGGVGTAIESAPALVLGPALNHKFINALPLRTEFVPARNPTGCTLRRSHSLSLLQRCIHRHHRLHPVFLIPVETAEGKSTSPREGSVTHTSCSVFLVYCTLFHFLARKLSGSGYSYSYSSFRSCLKNPNKLSSS